MNDCVVLVDNSNVWIEGIKLSAKRNKDIQNKQQCDYSWRINFDKLLHVVANKRNIKKTMLVGSKPPMNDKIWESAKRKGFEVTTFDRNSQGKEKAIDTEIVARGVEIIVSLPNPATLILLSGDSDFLPLIRIANERGWKTEVWAFKSALPKYADSIVSSVDYVGYLDDVFEEIGFNIRQE